MKQRQQAMGCPSWALGFILFMAGVTAMAWAKTSFVVNGTSSVEPGIYWMEPGEVERGSVIETCVGDYGPLFAERGYLPPGLCPGGVSRVLKRVAAVEGDVVTLSADGLAVDGMGIAEPLRTHDGLGRSIPQWPAGTYEVGRNEIWLIGNHDRALDSRIYGPVDSRQVECCFRRAFGE